MSFDLQKQDVAVHASRITRDLKKRVLTDSNFVRSKNAKPLIQSNNSLSVQTQSLSNRSDNTLLMSESTLYALKKRLLAPAWWVEGILLSLGSKEVWFDSLIAKRVGKVISTSSQINAKNITLMFAIWHELLSKDFSLKNEEIILRFQINKYLVGTQKEILDICLQLEEMWASPLNLFEVKSSKKSCKYSLSKVGSRNFVQHVKIENDIDGIWFSLNLSHSLQTICNAQKDHQETSLLKSSFISINPIVIQSMGRKASIKKILNYLFLEFSKQEQSLLQANNWGTIPIESKNINSFHKDILLNVPALYDHGVLGWNIGAPNIKISELKNKFNNNIENNSSKNSIIYCWQLSNQGKEASELEQAISEKLVPITIPTFSSNMYSQNLLNKTNYDGTLFPEPPPDQLKKARIEKALKAEKKVEKKIEITRNEISSKRTLKVNMVQTLFDSSDNGVNKVNSINKKEIIKKKIVSVKNVLSDNDFLILVSEFYESLKPLQKKAFERERLGMTSEQFRVYMTPILNRKKNKFLKK